MNRIDGMPTEFERKIFPGITTLGLLEKIQSLMRDLQCELAHSKDRIIFMSMYNDMGSKRKERKMWIQFKDNCELCSQILSRWSILGPGSEKKWCGTYTDRPDGSWHKTAENMIRNFSDSGHPIVRASSAFERGELKSKGGGKKSIHFNGSGENVVLLLRTAISANQLSVYGAVANLCNELSEDFRALGKPDWSFAHDSDSYCSIYLRSSNQWTATRKLDARTRANNRAIVRRPEIIHPYYVLKRVWS